MKPSLLLWTQNREEVDLELGAVLRHKPSRERSQQREKRMLKRGGQLSMTLFKYMDPAVLRIELHKDFSVI